ncbi:MAG: sensor histidine kinase [Geitlerinemataceae cyanobacterium]
MPSIRAIHPGRHPFPFLLYGEWALVAIALLSEISPSILPRGEVSIVAIASILSFGAIGLWLPTRPLALKLVHVGLQFGLFVLAARTSAIELRLFPLLQIVLVLRSCLLFELWGRLAVTGVTFALFLGMTQTRLYELGRAFPVRRSGRIAAQIIGIRLNLALMFLLVVVFLLLLMNALLSERKRREELRQANRKLRKSAAKIEQLAMNQERTRIARELHDSLGHSLTGLNIQLEGALKLWDANPEQARAFVSQAKVMGSTALQETRQAVATLRQPSQAQQGLADAIAPLLEQLQQTTGVTPDVLVDCPPLPESLKLTTYRIVQEALTNVCKYAQASSVSIAIQSAADALHITVRDDGIGFRPEDNATGFGLRGIQERAAAEGGRVQLATAPGEGCTLRVYLPLPLDT